ncbi:peptidoglycan DD-metalloendopeptidase family protein [Pseudodesulfovibrio sp. JC047]|uniref:murein hydrolase activator EnvC family protein n=1 Tax=Pseudodesulfovibrio sp. JC047 TaxID=2683199 RepID=UPI0013CF89E3|nr:peptidoglycan DD-metalloendopeptidase family protein [Pseudodesulfovibrio sp. JC047]NDV19162.1 peptidoglycan DD-metalloendopeptidase family protein [Pseudodesulfovibrio sp. JC047]
MYKSFFVIFFLLVLIPSVVNARDSEETLHESLMQEHQRADDNEKKVRELTRRAGQISTRISGVEHDIKFLQRKIRLQETALEAIRKEEHKARKDYFVLEAQKKQISFELSGLMHTLWPIHLHSAQGRFDGVENWAMFDRRFNWLAKIYGATSDKLDEARQNAEHIAENLEHQQLLEVEAEKQLASINKSKDRLLKNTYALRKNLRKIRKQRQDTESELTDILSTIETLKYQLQSQKTKRFSVYKRTLPWPVQGRLVSRFNLRATPPIRGLGIKTSDGANVQSIFWGKVVHNDTLRGFGHVIIVYHGYDYYSLYAYLSDTFVRNGQEVEKDEPLGKVGYYPKADGPGLYFELRFHQKPINPRNWLTAS